MSIREGRILNVCPAALVNAPLDVAWAVLSDPGQYDAWWDARTDSIQPAGSAQPGQTIRGSSRALVWRWRISTVVEAVEPERHRLRLRTTLPIGLVILNTISCSPEGPDTTRVQFG